MELCSCFQRFEQKYLLDTDTYQKLRLELTPYMESDQYGISHISSIYFDTPDRRLVRSSLEKPVYKEKLRLRCYGLPGPQDPVYVEVKKKYKGIVYKSGDAPEGSRGVPLPWMPASQGHPGLTRGGLYAPILPGIGPGSVHWL